MTNVELRDPQELKNHPLNQQIYGEDVDQELLDDIKGHGVREPIQITADDIVISGHRRRHHAIVAGVDRVPVIVRHDLIDPLDIEEALIRSNRCQRDRTTEQKVREAQELERIGRERARQRQAHGQTAPGKRFGKDFTKAFNSSGARSEEVAAKHADMSRPTYRLAKDVVAGIDAAIAEGNTQRAEELQKELNRNVRGAHRQATRERAGQYARGLAAIEGVDAFVAEGVRSKRLMVSKSAVAEIGMLFPKELPIAVENIKKGCVWHHGISRSQRKEAVKAIAEAINAYRRMTHQTQTATSLIGSENEFSRRLQVLFAKTHSALLKYQDHITGQDRSNNHDEDQF